MNIFLEINHIISKFLNNLVIGNNGECFVGIFADAPIFFLPIFLLISWFYRTYFKSNIDNKKNLLIIFYGIILSVIINIVIQQFVLLDRPENLVKPILEHLPDASFPSDHASVSFAFLAGLFLSGYRKIGYVFSVFVIFMNLSRVAGGIHWFFDIIAGGVIGIFSSYILFKFRGTKYIDSVNNYIIKILSFFKM